jgi:hypothetical protein
VLSTWMLHWWGTTTSPQYFFAWCRPWRWRTSSH